METMMFWLQLVEMEQIHYTCRCPAGFDATMMLLVNTLTLRAKGVVAKFPYVTTAPFFHVSRQIQYH
jgi:hypothetical protein